MPHPKFSGDNRATSKRTPPGKCSICEDPAKDEFVSRLIAQGYNANRIEAASRTEDAKERGVVPMKYETIRKHIAHLLPVPIKDLPSHVQTKLAQRHVQVQAQPPGPERERDFARLVRDIAAEKLANGELRVTTQHGLQAQQMMDKREERRKDREVQIQVARLLSRQYDPPKELIEGSYEVLPLTSGVEPSEEKEDFPMELSELTKTSS